MPRKRGGRKTGGRRKGTPNKATVEVKAVCGAIVDDRIYLKNLVKRARAGRLPPAVETMIWHYAKGKPAERVELKTDVLTAEAAAKMSDAELKAEMRAEAAVLLANAERL